MGKVGMENGLVDEVYMKLKRNFQGGKLMMMGKHAVGLWSRTRRDVELDGGECNVRGNWEMVICRASERPGGKYMK